MKTVLITGASKGIGLELTKIFAREKYNLVLVARSEDLLKQLASDCEKTYKIKAHVLPADLSEMDAASKIIKNLDDNAIKINTLVNNAGFGSFKAFAHTDLDTVLGIIKVNILALTELTHRLLPHMMAQKQGEILNIASSAAFQPGPYAAVYYASKAYVLSFSESLWAELKKYNIVVTASCPGITQTEFFKRAGNINKIKVGHNPLLHVMDAKTVAKRSYHGLKRKKRVIIPDYRLKLMPYITALSPRILVNAILKSVHQKYLSK